MSQRRARSKASTHARKAPPVIRHGQQSGLNGRRALSASHAYASPGRSVSYSVIPVWLVVHKKEGKEDSMKKKSTSLMHALLCKTVVCL